MDDARNIHSKMPTSVRVVGWGPNTPGALHNLRGAGNKPTDCWLGKEGVLEGVLLWEIRPHVARVNAPWLPQVSTDVGLHERLREGSCQIRQLRICCHGGTRERQLEAQHVGFLNFISPFHQNQSSHCTPSVCVFVGKWIVGKTVRHLLQEENQNNQRTFRQYGTRLLTELTEFTVIPSGTQ